MALNHDEAEMAVIGGVLLSHSAARQCLLQTPADAFFDPKHRKFWQRLQKAFADGFQIDVVTIGEIAKDFGGSAFIARLVESCPASAAAADYAAIVRSKWRRRQLLEGIQAIAPRVDSDENLGDLAAQLTDLACEVQADAAYTLAAHEIVSRIASRKEEPAKFAPTGFEPIDCMRGGLPVGDMAILSGETGSGKTMLACQIAKDFVLRGKRVAFISLEMSAEELLEERLMPMLTGIFTPSFSPDKWQKGEDLLWASKMVFRDRSRERRPMTVFGAIEWLEGVRRDGGLDLAVIDYFQKLKAPGFKGESYERYAFISEELRSYFKRAQIPNLILSQVTVDDQNARINTRGGEDFKNDAGLMISLLPKRYKRGEERPKHPPVEFITVKNRKGPKNRCWLAQDQFGAFHETEVD